jgi:hypothetical protein
MAVVVFVVVLFVYIWHRTHVKIIGTFMLFGIKTLA